MVLSMAWCFMNKQKIAFSVLNVPYLGFIQPTLAMKEKICALLAFEVMKGRKFRIKDLEEGYDSRLNELSADTKNNTRWKQCRFGAVINGVS